MRPTFACATPNAICSASAASSELHLQLLVLSTVLLFMTPTLTRYS
ncbi:MAG TPA: hypothetical protein VGG63_04235 [Steroidobacteraceae bacterium]